MVCVESAEKANDGVEESVLLRHSPRLRGVSGRGCKMRLTIVPPLYLRRAGLRVRAWPSVPLGVLILAAVAEQAGHAVSLVDLNLAMIRGRVRYDAGFADRAAEVIAASRPAVVAFSTMPGGFTQMLRVAAALRRRAPDVRILMGGPAAASVADQTVRDFDFVSAVARREGELILPQLLQWAAGDRDLADIPGISFRRGDEVVRNPDAELINDLDAMPMPALSHLDTQDLPPRSFPIEVARGCPYRCSFCTANKIYGDRRREKSSDRIVEEIARAKAVTGRRFFSFVDDLFTTNRRSVVATCEAILARGLDIEWSCYARTDRVDSELMRLMSRAGCSHVFFGIDAASASQQAALNKKLDLAEVENSTTAALAAGIQPTISMIVGCPDETLADLAAQTALIARLARIGVRDFRAVQLVFYEGAPITEEYRDQLRLCERRSTMFWNSLQAPDWDLVERHPDMFPQFKYLPSAKPWPFARWALGQSLVVAPRYLKSLPEPTAARRACQ